MTTELLSGIDLKGFFGVIEVKLSEIGLAVGGCLEEVDVCLHWHHVFVGSVCVYHCRGRGRCLVLRQSQQLTVPYAVE